MTDSQSERMTVEQARKEYVSAELEVDSTASIGLGMHYSRKANTKFDRLRQAILEEHQEKVTALVAAVRALVDDDESSLTDGEMGYCLGCGGVNPRNGLTPEAREHHLPDCLVVAIVDALRAVSPTPVEEGGAA